VSDVITMTHLDSQTLQLVIVALTALALLVQAIALLAIFITLRKSVLSMRGEIEDLRTTLMPLIYDARELLSRLSPVVETTVKDLSHMAHSLRDQTAEVQSSVHQILYRLQLQTNRLDAMFSGALDTVDQATSFVSGTVGKQVRQISGLLASAKAVVESLRSSQPAPSPSHARQDRDSFV
jgi:hypothetical protein